ncbi:MAG: redoxin family protein, partial [Desulfobacterales bacterium]|nr:redoxin family protein [Desulfobacterales bacterium]
MMVLALTWMGAPHLVRADAGGIVKGMEIAEFDRMTGGSGERYLVVIMAAWCAPCRKELPILVKLYDRYKSRGLSMIGLSVDLSGPGAMEPIARKAGVPFPIYWLGEAAVAH